MRSLYIRILSVSLITAIVTFAAFAAIAGRVMRSTGGALFKGAYSLQIDQAIDAYERGGAISLASFITRLDAALGMEHHLVNAEGQDLVTGVNRARLLTAEGHHDQAQVIDGRFVAVRASRDGRYKLIVSAVPPFSMATFIPFYVLVLVTVCVLSWFVALGIASPLRTDVCDRGAIRARRSRRAHERQGKERDGTAVIGVQRDGGAPADAPRRGAAIAAGCFP